MRSIITTMLILGVAACGDDGASGDDTSCTGPSCDAAACVEAWQCTPWETAGTGNAGTRTCTDLNQCGTVATKPLEAATLPALDPEYYECNVEPIVVGRCSMLGCHGTETGRAYRLYARGRLRITGKVLTEQGCGNPGTMHPSEDCTGGIECRCWGLPQLVEERRRSFDSARGFGLDTAGAPLADVTQSELLRQPLVGGGFAHAGISMWSATDPEYAAVKSWLSGATRGTPCNSMN